MIFSERVKHRIALIFLLAFISIKAEGLHSLTHSKDIQKISHCSWCNLAHDAFETPLLITPQSWISAPEEIEVHSTQKNQYYKLAKNLKQPICLIFNKPPPDHISPFGFYPEF